MYVGDRSGSAALSDCPFDSAQSALVVVGAPLADQLLIKQKGSVIEVSFSKGARFRATFAADGICAFIVHGMGGNDTIDIDSSDHSRVSIPAWLFGGPGNDRLHVQGGDSNNVLVGTMGTTRWKLAVTVCGAARATTS